MLAETPISIRPLDDTDLIASAIRHPRVYPHVSDDGSPSPENFRAHPGFLYLGAFDGDEFLGVFVVHPHNLVLYEVHTCLLPKAWGSRTLTSAKSVIRWVFDNTPCRRLMTCVPEGNDLALYLAQRAGMEKFGVNPRSILKGGVLLDQALLAIEKE